LPPEWKEHDENTRPSQTGNPIEIGGIRFYERGVGAETEVGSVECEKGVRKKKRATSERCVKNRRAKAFFMWVGDNMKTYMKKVFFVFFRFSDFYWVCVRMRVWVCVRVCVCVVFSVLCCVCWMFSLP
jgi:hypothetical protein